jgi:hypothetical protein
MQLFKKLDVGFLEIGDYLGNPHSLMLNFISIFGRLTFFYWYGIFWTPNLKVELSLFTPLCSMNWVGICTVFSVFSLVVCVSQSCSECYTMIGCRQSSFLLKLYLHIKLKNHYALYCCILLTWP